MKNPDPMKTLSGAARARRPAFTLIELLTVIAIVGILVAIIVPVVGKVRVQAQHASSMSNLRQLALASDLYANDNRGFFPRQHSVDDNGKWEHQWPEQIRGYVTNAGASKSPANSVFFCPAEEVHHPDIADYGSNPYVIEALKQKPAVRRENVRNPSRQIMFATARERAQQRGAWYVAREYVTSPDGVATYPSDRGKGSVLLVYVAGNTAKMKETEVVENRKLLFTGVE